MSAISENGTAINPPGPLRLRPDPKWDQRNPLKLICRLVLEEVHPTGQNQEPSFDGHNRHGNLRYAWAVDLGPFKPGR